MIFLIHRYSMSNTIRSDMEYIKILMMMNEPIYIIILSFLSSRSFPFYHHRKYDLWFSSWIYLYILFHIISLRCFCLFGFLFSEEFLLCVILIDIGTMLQEYAEVNSYILQTIYYKQCVWNMADNQLDNYM